MCYPCLRIPVTYVSGLYTPLQKGDRGRAPLGCATMSGSFPAGPPRNADQGGQEGDLSFMPCGLCLAARCFPIP